MKLKKLFQAAALAATALPLAAAAATFSVPVSAKVASGGSVSGDGLTVHFEYDSAYSGFDNSKGAQLGKAAEPPTYVKVTVSPIVEELGKVRSATINASGASSIKATLTASIGEVRIGETVSLTQTATDYPFETEPGDDQSGALVFYFANSSQKAIYVKSVSVTVNDAPTADDPGAMAVKTGKETTIDLSAVFADADDPDGLSYSANVGSIADGVWSFTPQAAGSTAVSITATDPWGDSAVASFTVTASDSAVAPQIALSAESAETSIGTPVSVVVSANADAAFSVAPPASVDAASFTFDRSTGAFSFTPAAAGSFEFVFTAADQEDASLATTATFTVDVGLAAPTGLAAAASGTSIALSWDPVPGAAAYEVSLVPVPVEVSFDDSLGGSSSYAKHEGTAAAPYQSVAWSTDGGRGDVNIKDTRSISIKNGAVLEIGPFKHGIASMSFKYAQTNTKICDFAVSVVSSDSSGTYASGSTGGGSDKGVVHEVEATCGVFGECSVQVSVSKDNAVSFDEFVFVPSLDSFGPERTSEPEFSFDDLPQAAFYKAVVKAVAGSVVSEESVALAETEGNHPPTVAFAESAVAAVVGAPVRIPVSMSDPDGDELSTVLSPAGLATLETDEETGAVELVFTPSAVGTTSFELVVEDPAGESATATVSVAASLAAISNLRCTDTSFNSTVLEWDPVPGADGYRVDASCRVVRGAVAIEESFDGFASLSSGAVSAGNEDNVTEVPGWTLENAYKGTASKDSFGGEASTAAKFGTGGKAGSITSPALDLSQNGGNFVVSFDARRWSGDADSIWVVVDGVTNETAVAIGDKMEPHVVECSGGTASSVVQITAGKASNNRFFMDDLVIVSGTVSSIEIATGAETAEPRWVATGLLPSSKCSFSVTAYAAVDGGEAVSSASVSEVTEAAPPVTLLTLK
ncbi:MAG: hypothetical protein IJ678_00475 [Kiritimatiellae bacterium]|nr:hypothetical protein [Kiritimatiellia bacterium]